MWEEPCISGTEGSGAVFFSGCNLGCVYCQNRDISRGQRGREILASELADIFLRLQDEKKANNINLVTPSHYVRQIIEALDIAKSHGLRVPVVYNTGTYELTETLRMLEGYVDVYLPDCKYFDEKRAVKYSNAPGYFEIAFEAIKEMYRQVGKPQFNEKGIMTKGVIARLLILPEGTKDSKAVLEKLYGEFGNDIYYSIMSQYTPMNMDSNGDKSAGNDLPKDFPELCRKITKREYNRVIDYALELGIDNAFIQEGDVARESFIPAWDLE